MIRIQAVAAVLLIAVVAPAVEVKFTAGPKAVREGNNVAISFTVNRPTDVEVAIVDGGGKVVRRLAAGVLGGQAAPPAPLKAGLAQAVAWDGKDDAGNLVIGSRVLGPGEDSANPGSKTQSPGPKTQAPRPPFTVRVRAGMGVAFGRTVADSPYNFNETVCRGLAVDANGDLYMLGQKDRDGVIFFLRAYDRTGKYLRELLPYPASLSADAREPFGVVPLAEGQPPAPQNHYSLWPVFYPFKYVSKAPQVKLTAIVDDQLVLLDEGFDAMYRISKKDGSPVSKLFVEPLWAKGTKMAGSNMVGPVMMTLSPDRKSAYFAGYCSVPAKGAKLAESWPEGRIYRAAWPIAAAQPAGFADVALPQTARKPEIGWNITGHQQAIHGVTVDKAGQVYVCDQEGGKVWMFTAEGKAVSSLDVPFAYLAAVNDKTGELYVVTRQHTVHGVVKKTLVKLSGAKPGAAIVDTLGGFPDKGGATDPFMAADFTGPVPQIWLSGCPRGDSLLRIEDRGGKLTIVEDLADRGQTSAGFAARLAVDPETDLVYINDGWEKNLRYNGLTGEYAGKTNAAGRPIPVVGSELCVRRDGMVYASGETYSGQFTRYNRDLSPAPLDGGQSKFGYYDGRMGGGYFGNHGCRVTPAGRLVVCAMFNWCQYCVMDFAPDGKAISHERLKDVPWSDTKNYKQAGVDSALIGWLPSQCGGLAVGPDGSVYLGLRVLPRDFKLPPAWEKTPGFASQYGSIIKFKPSGGGMYPDDGAKGVWKNGDTFQTIVPEKFADGLPMGSVRTQHGVAPKQTYIEGAVKAYPGLAPFSGWNRSDGCVCQSPRFDVDDFGRLYVPDALTCSVTVLDNEGNHILRFGSDANRDSGVGDRGSGIGDRKKNPSETTGARPSPQPPSSIPLAYPVAAQVSFKHIYVADSANRRVVRVDPAYAAEATCRRREIIQ